MTKKPHKAKRLFHAISKCLPLAIKLDAPIFRSVSVKYANKKDFISGEGARIYGGRWNPKGIDAVYGSLEPVTAVHESLQEFIKYGFRNAAIKPRVIAGVKVKVSRLLDLTDAKIRQKLGFSLDELRSEDWSEIQRTGEESWTQTIGATCRSAGFEGLRAPSARHSSGKNVVIFPDKLDCDSSIEPISKEDLPPHPSKWPK